MANTTSARKAARKIARRTAVNQARRTRARTAVRQVEDAIAAGDRNKALALFAAVIRAIGDTDNLETGSIVPL